MDWEWEWDGDVGGEADVEAGAEIWPYPYREGSEERGGGVDVGSVNDEDVVSNRAFEGGDNSKDEERCRMCEDED
jgi:hypothetical protein